MNDHPSTQAFSSHHHHHQLTSCHLASHSLQGPELGYPPSQLHPGQLEERGSQEEDSAMPYLISSPPPGGRRVRIGSDGGLLKTSSGSVNGDGDMVTSGHFAETYGYCTGKREEGESFESAVEYLYSKGNGCIKGNDVSDVLNLSNQEGMFMVDKTEASMSQQATPFDRSASDGQEYCRTNSTMSDNYMERDEDCGSSCGTGEDHLQHVGIEGSWFSASPSIGPADTHAGDLAQHSPVSIGSGIYPQKLDSFSDAFLSQRKGRFPMIPSDDPGVQLWDFRRGGSPRLERSRQSCAFDPDPYLPPACPLSPFHSSLQSFHSPPISSPLMPAVLSPPPTPRPPPSFSPPKMDSSFHPQSLPSVHSSGMIWKLPLMAQESPTLKVDHESVAKFVNFSDARGNLRCLHNDAAASQNSKSPETFLASVLPGLLCPPTTICLPQSFRHRSLPAHPNVASERSEPLVVTQRVDIMNPAQHQASQIYTGTPFPSILRSGGGQRKDRYTPLPLLNPVRRGKGLFFNLSPQHHREAADSGGDGGVLPCVNIGHEFQAQLPLCAPRGHQSARWLPDEPREQLLCKPWRGLEDNAYLQDQVEKLLSVCSSSCLPGGGSNTELALHCLHHCQGDTMATLEMLLFSQPSPAGDYHYSGSDVWTDAEKTVFTAALGTYGKEFSLIQKTVRTKNVQQCVEFFYLNKRLHEKQEKQKQESQDGGLGQHTDTTPNCKPMNRPFVPQEVVPVPSTAGFFPCKLCGKMFHKIKSRNAHMKIHRQPQEDWTDRRLQQQLVSPRSGGNLLPAHVPFRSLPSPYLPGRTRNADSVLNLLTGVNAVAPSNTGALDPSAMVTCSNNGVPNSHVSADTTQRERASGVPFFQSWSSLGPDPAAFFCNTEGKDAVGTGALGAKEPIKWQ